MELNPVSKNNIQCFAATCLRIRNDVLPHPLPLTLLCGPLKQLAGFKGKGLQPRGSDGPVADSGKRTASANNSSLLALPSVPAIPFRNPTAPPPPCWAARLVAVLKAKAGSGRVRNSCEARPMASHRNGAVHVSCIIRQ